MNTSNWTGRTHRTSESAFGCTGHCIEVHRAPLWKRAIWFACKYGWAVFVAAMLIAVVWQGLQGPSDVQAAQDVADEVQAVESRGGRP